MRQIYVLLTKYSDWLSAVVCHVSGRGFTHSSISLDEDPDTYYSFNFRGFAVETAEKHRRRGVRDSRCIQLQISTRLIHASGCVCWTCLRTGQNTITRGWGCFSAS